MRNIAKSTYRNLITKPAIRLINLITLASLLNLEIALLMVSWQSWKAAKRNPVEALRYE